MVNKITETPIIMAFILIKANEYTLNRSNLEYLISALIIGFFLDHNSLLFCYIKKLLELSELFFTFEPGIVRNLLCGYNQNDKINRRNHVK
jgi:hypothetical protein